MGPIDLTALSNKLSFIAMPYSTCSSRSEYPCQSNFEYPCSIRSTDASSTSGAFHFRDQPMRSLSSRPGNSLTFLTGVSSMCFKHLIFLLPAIQATEVLALFLTFPYRSLPQILTDAA